MQNTKDVFDFILLFVQIASLIALIIYVCKTWQIANANQKSAEISRDTLLQMKESRDKEYSPYISVYFDIPYGTGDIFFIIKNLGRTNAKNIYLKFDPALCNTDGQYLEETNLLKNGIPSMPPGHEIRFYFDQAISIFEKAKTPKKYDVEISFDNELTNTKVKFYQVIDLSIYVGLTYLQNKSIHDLVNQFERSSSTFNKIENDISKIANNLSEGLWINNADLFSSTIELSSEGLTKNLYSKLNEFVITWEAIYNKDHAKFKGKYKDLLKRLGMLGYQILALSSKLTNEKIDEVLQIVRNLVLLSNFQFCQDGGKSVREFEALGNEAYEKCKYLLTEHNTGV